MPRSIITINSFIFLLSSIGIHAQSDLIEIPFHIIGKMIVVQGNINGRNGNIAIDTGIPTMLINKRFFGDLDLFSTGATGGFQSISGKAEKKGVALVTIKIRDFSVNAGADVIDLQTVERQKRTDLLGMIGINLFRKYELEIDNHSEVIRLYRLDKQGRRRLQQADALPSEAISFQYYQHLPYITTYLHGMPLNLGLDTGAEKTLVAASVYEKIKSQLRNAKPQMMIDLQGKVSEGIAAQVDGLQVGGLEISAIPALFIPMNTHYGSLNRKKIQGLLGYDFLQYFRLAINFKKKKIYLWTEQQNDNMPLVVRKN